MIHEIFFSLFWGTYTVYSDEKTYLLGSHEEWNIEGARLIGS